MTTLTLNLYRAALVAAATQLLLLVTPATAAPPARTPFQIDETFPSRFLTNQCGIPVWVHMEGAGTMTLHYDKSGTLIRELDTLAQGLTSTYFSPVELGGTGKSLTQVIHSPTTILYPDGTDIGDPAIVIYNGVQFTAGTGSPRIVGHEIYEAVIVELTPEGMPIFESPASISQAGQFDVAAVVHARCAVLSEP